MCIKSISSGNNVIKVGGVTRMLNEKRTFKEFIKGNGFYVITGVALIAVVVTAMIVPKKGEGKVDKEPERYADKQQVDAAEDISELRIPTVESRMDIEDEMSIGMETNDNEPVVEIEDKPKADEEEITSETFSSTTTEKDEIFHSDDELFSWPVDENIIYDYSDNDVGRSFMNPTLDRTMRTFGLFLKTEEDTKVKAAASGKVLSVSEYPTTDIPSKMDYPQVGTAVIVDHGNDWKTVYGLHTGKALVTAGDTISAGDVVGSVGKPSKDFSLTGPNLYFQVLKNDTPVNPKDMLR